MASLLENLVNHSNELHVSLCVVIGGVTLWVLIDLRVECVTGDGK